MLEEALEPQASSAQVNGELPRGSAVSPCPKPRSAAGVLSDGTSGMADLDS